MCLVALFFYRLNAPFFQRITRALEERTAGEATRG